MCGATTESKCNGRGVVSRLDGPMCVYGDGFLVTVRVESEGVMEWYTLLVL